MPPDYSSFGSVTNMGSTGLTNNAFGGGYGGYGNYGGGYTPNGADSKISPYGALPGAGLGLLQAGVGLYGLSHMGAMPNYSVSPELQGAYGNAQSDATYGYSPAQKIAYQQDVAGQQNRAGRQAVDVSGGQGAQAINGILNSQRLGAANQFAGQDAQLQQQKREYADNFASQIQQQKNMATQAALQNYISKQQAYGGALATGTSNAAGGIGSFLSLLPLLGAL